MFYIQWKQLGICMIFITLYCKLDSMFTTPVWNKASIFINIIAIDYKLADKESKVRQERYFVYDNSMYQYEFYIVSGSTGESTNVVPVSRWTGNYVCATEVVFQETKRYFEECPRSFNQQYPRCEYRSFAPQRRGHPQCDHTGTDLLENSEF